MSAPKRLPTVPYEPVPEGTNARDLNFMKRMSRGYLPREGPADAVEEMERALEWATRDVPEEECT